MARYIVTVARIVKQLVEIEVEADSAIKAKEKALEEAPDIDFAGKEKEADYEVSDYELIKKK